MSKQPEHHELSEFDKIEDSENPVQLTSSPTDPNGSQNEVTGISAEDTRRSQPEATPDMALAPPRKHEDPNDSEGSSITVSEVGSGYERENNECTEFCMDFLTCFGLFDTCCPTSGEGYLTTAAAFCGNILVSCCKCK